MVIMAHILFGLFFIVFIPFSVYLATRINSSVMVLYADKSPALQFGISNGVFSLGAITSFLMSTPVAAFMGIGWGGQELILVGLESSLVLIFSNFIIELISFRMESLQRGKRQKFVVLIGIGLLASIGFTILMYK